MTKTIPLLQDAPIPILSMYGIFTYIHECFFLVNVGRSIYIYQSHGSCGISSRFLLEVLPWFPWFPPQLLRDWNAASPPTTSKDWFSRTSKDNFSKSTCWTKNLVNLNRYIMILLMEEILHHLFYMETLWKMGDSPYQLVIAGFLNHQQYIPHPFCFKWPFYSAPFSSHFLSVKCVFFLECNDSPAKKHNKTPLF